jgi:geranylgeranyl pyrophosphate synthase
MINFRKLILKRSFSTANTNTNRDAMNKISSIDLNVSRSPSGVSNSLTQYKELINKSSYIVEQIFPRKFKTRQQMIDYFNFPSLSKNISIEGNVQVDSTNKGILNPGWDLISRGGKKWRPAFGLIVSNYFNIDIDNLEKNNVLYKLLYVSELVHNASLIIDDVEDKSESRRNEPCVHLKFGEDIAINAGVSMLYFPIYSVIKSVSDPVFRGDLCQSYLEECTAIHIGQGWDIEMKAKDNIPTVDNYMDMVICKTGVCPRMIIKFIKVYAQHNMKHNRTHNTEFQEFMDIADFLSIAFQIRDDVLNITPSALSKGKNLLGEDIYGGKLTLMVLHTLNSNNPNKHKLKEILEMKTNSELLINEAINILKDNGSIDFANNLMEKHFNLVKQKCDKLSQNKSGNFRPETAYHIMDLLNYLIERNI